MYSERLAATDQSFRWLGPCEMALPTVWLRFVSGQKALDEGKALK